MRLPVAIKHPPITTFNVTSSFKKINESIMVITTLSLSIGATFETSPICIALK